MKVCFDFDNTLDIITIKTYAKELINQGIDVWICTQRPCDEDAPNKSRNLDLWQVVKYLNIPKNQVIFLNLKSKFTFFLNKDFIWHLDDDWTEIKKINENTDTKGITHFGNKFWRFDCDDLLK
jgi:hypothetical protein